MIRLLALLLWCTALQTNAQPRQVPITIKVDMTAHDYAIPPDYVGLGFETRSILPDTYGVSGHFFSPENKQLIRLFQNAGIKHIRIGGGTVDGSGAQEHCVIPIPDTNDIDHLFEFARLAGVKVIYSFRLLNLAACRNDRLASDNAKIADYIWRKYRANLDSFSIGNEPDVLSFHSKPDRMADPDIYETVPGTPGSAYASYLKAWRHFAGAILKLVPQARFSGPDTAVSTTSSFTPNPSASPGRSSSRMT